jgi:hypothetical protein
LQEKYPGHFGGFEVFKEAKAFLNDMERYGWRFSYNPIRSLRIASFGQIRALLLGVFFLASSNLKVQSQ